MNQCYQIGEFARHAGVTVRTLHHYDRLGLLRPVTHRDNGYRLYGESELARLSQIVTLRTLGFDLAAIKAILDAPDFDLRTALRAQILLLEERRNLLDVAIGTLRNVEQQADTETPTWGTLAPTIEAMLAVQKIDFSKHYTPEQLAALRARELQPEEQANISARWNQLFRDIDAASGDDPASDRAQALLDQWDALIAEFTLNDPGLERSLASVYADPENRKNAATAMPLLPKAASFMEAARAWRSKPGDARR